MAGERTWNIDGWDITCQMDFSGYEVYEQYLFPIDGETQNLTYVFLHPGLPGPSLSV